MANLEIKSRTVALVTLGCVRNETDSEELAGRLAADGWQLVSAPALAEIPSFPTRRSSDYRKSVV